MTTLIKANEELKNHFVQFSLLKIGPENWSRIPMVSPGFYINISLKGRLGFHRFACAVVAKKSDTVKA